MAQRADDLGRGPRRPAAEFMRRVTSSMVVPDCACAAASISRAVVPRVVQICSCWARVRAPACSQCCCSEAAMASRAAACVPRRASSRAASSACIAAGVRQGCRAAPPSAPRRSRRRPAAIRAAVRRLSLTVSWRASAVLQVSATVVTVLPNAPRARRAGLLRARRGRVAGRRFLRPSPWRSRPVPPACRRGAHRPLPAAWPSAARRCRQRR